MRVLLVFFSDPWTPFSPSVAALAAAARAAGHEPSALSVDLRADVAEAASRVDAMGADVVGVTLMTRDWPVARALLELLGPGPFVVAGGYHASLAPRDVASCARVDAVAIGEGERSLPALLDRLAAGAARETFPGMWVREAGRFVEPIPAGDPVLDIAALPRWDYDVLGDVRAMLARGINTFGREHDRFLPTRASRGCPFTCAYCSAPVWGKTAGFEVEGARNVRPVEHFADELVELRDRYDPAGFEMWDEHFPFDVRWLRELAQVLPRRVGLPFKVEMHPNVATKERVLLLREAGCVHLHCGVEVGDPGLRRGTLDRRASDAVMSRVFEDAREVGLMTSASVMMGVPGETFEQVEQTLSLVRSLSPGSLTWANYAALPATALTRRRADGLSGRDAPPEHALQETEKLALHARFVSLAEELAGERARARRVAIPDAAPPEPGAPPTAELQALLGPLPARVELAWWEQDGLALRVSADALPPRVVRVVRNDGARYYAKTARLALLYDGTDLPPPLARLLDALAARLSAGSLDELRATVGEGGVG